ncbi:concanavalin A-like lectin/glucanase domain-containing protein [Gilbertella persicaria]|uniref:concanavalin A-like lectin/glucanase domain-containing protein n=1 Tax=Gilbertella persicaria TaxID=101096 RepID=UPI00222011B5|nr:concanavalin A-like lectin/glucanase domain-containing protein [Gilbertella persicaria]KAI8069803.1 concanavalin A-like lectin/glucanase domain-containing protein [Gilbertella persicaria]
MVVLKSAFLASLVAFTCGASAWTVKEALSGENFFNGFDYFTGADPTHGFVQYVDKATAKAKNLIYTQNGQVIIKADNSTVTPNGRPSIRLTSHYTFTTGLVVLDLEHMPTGCGTWPAFWTLGTGTWPNNGEIDIIEGVHNQAHNQVTLHTSAGCTMEGVSRSQTGKVLTPNCDVNAGGQAANAGCGVEAPNTNTYGAGLNNIRGGVYATLWTNQGIRTWFFPRGSIPSDITKEAPNPDAWGKPIANFPFGSNCPSSKFKNHNVIFDLTFCGDWAGSVYGNSGCPSTCVDYVQNNPSAFSQAYWKINSLKIFQQ